MAIRGLVDSGNMIPQAGAMSTALARLLGIPFRPIECSIGTAKVGGKLTVRGIAANIRISLRADLVCNLRQVLVIDNLSGDLNLGYHFLRSVKGTLQFRSTGTTLQIAGTSIPLIQQLNLNNPPEEIAPDAVHVPAAAAPAPADPTPPPHPPPPPPLGKK